jgi:hypothetical protein
MSPSDLQQIADAVVLRAQRQGSVSADEVREALTQAGQPEALWQDVLALARTALSYRDGRYHFVARRAAHEQEQQQRIRDAVRQLAEQHKEAATVERREQDRIDFVQPVRVETEDGRAITLLTRDLSPNGIRLVGTHRLLGQKVRVRVPRRGGTWCFTVRVLWTCAVGDDLVENGGMFLEVEELV